MLIKLVFICKEKKIVGDLKKNVPSGVKICRNLKILFGPYFRRLRAPKGQNFSFYVLCLISDKNLPFLKIKNCYFLLTVLSYFMNYALSKYRGLVKLPKSQKKFLKCSGLSEMPHPF